ncbi:MAG: putative tail length tape measure protein [Prokaryotic dsDNA virus sp.]|nr:MAG: putative tail length tape measure protein [Prokaryotic dsDNA virus sp.]|tara:strand:- start:14146 stop:18129 length:3984 start_codon:yes stop_codon:yes gene_type:complete
MAEFATLLLKADTTGLERGKKVLDETTRAGARTEKAVGGTERGFVRAGRGAGQATPQIKGFNSAADQTRAMALAATKVLAGLAASFTSLRAVGQASQAYARIGNSLRALGVDAGQVPAQIQAIGDIAIRTRAPLEATAQLYQRISIAGKDLGASQADVLRFTENVNLALAQQGGSAEAASGALLQLSQAMAGGVIRAEEFNSILEGAYPIAQAAANAIDGAAGSVGRLRAMVIEGEISSREFFDAIMSSTEALEAAFGSTVPTVSQAVSVLGTSFTLFVGELDSALGASAALAEGIILLAENIDRIAIYAATAAGVIGGAYVAAMVTAAAKTLTLSRALITLRKAFIRTGIGALVVLAGEMIYQFTELVKTTGGVGKAFVQLGNVAGAVWQGIVDSAAAIPPALNGVWNLMKSGFLLALSDMATGFFDFVWKMANGMSGVPAFEGMSAALMNVANSADEASGSLARSGYAARDAASGAFATAAGTIKEAFGPAREALAALGGSVEETEAAASELEDTGSGLNDTLEDTGGAGAKAAKGAGAAADELERAKTEAEAFNDALKEAAFTAEDMGTEKANILVSGIDGVANAFGDFVADGFSSFKDFASSILDTFKGMLSQMIAMAAKNRIMIGMGISAGGVGGTAAQAAAPGGGGLGNLMGIGGGAGGMFGSLLGAWGGGSGILGGASAALGAFTSGGIGGGLSAVGAMATQATSGLAGLGTAIGAVALPVAAVAAVFSFFSSKTKILDKGLRITADATSTLVEEFEKIEKSRFWGLSKSRSTNYSPMEDDGPIKDAVDEIKNSALAMGDVLGLSADNFSSFASQISVSLKDLSEEEAQAEIQRAFGVLAEQFSYAALGHFQEELGNVIREGETADQALSALASSLQTANIAFRDLGFTMYETSVAGGVAAREFADLFGGVEQMAQATSAYYQRFYTDAEQVTNATRNMREAMAELGLIMPATIEGFRALVEQAERMGNMEQVASLIGMSGAFAGMIDGQQALQDKAAQDLQAAFAREMEATRAASQAAISGLQNSLTGARERLASSRAIANALESALKSRIFPSVEAERQAQDRAAEYLRSLVGQGEINDLDALQAALQAVANPSADTYETLEDYRRDFDRTSGVIRALEKTAAFALSADERSVLLLEQQIAAMETQADREVDMLQQQLDALLGVNDSVLSLKSAIAGFQATQAATSGGGSGAGSAPVYDFSGSDGGDGSDWQEYMRSVSSYDGGGYTGNGPRSGGLDGKGGFMAMLHPRETVTDHTKGGNGRLEALVAQLSAKVDELTAINRSTARHTGKSAAIAQKWDDTLIDISGEEDALRTRAAS